MVKNLRDVLRKDEYDLYREIRAARRVANQSGDQSEVERLCRAFYDLRLERGVKRFEIGQTYFRMDGRTATIIIRKDDQRFYETVVADDGTKASPEIHRYNRSNGGGDCGRVTGTNHSFTDPRNLIAEAA